MRALSLPLSFLPRSRSTAEPDVLPRAPLARPHAVLSLFKGSTDPRDQRLRLAAMALLAWGVLVMVVSLTLNVYHLVHQPAQNSLHTLGYLGGKLHGAAVGARE